MLSLALAPMVFRFGTVVRFRIEKASQARGADHASHRRDVSCFSVQDGGAVNFPAAKAIAMRYALALVCAGAAALLQRSPVGPLFHTTGPFILAVLAAAWFGGIGPGLLTAFLAAL